MKKIVLTILIVAFTFSCNNETELSNIESILIAKGDLGGNGAEGISKQNMVITDQNNWVNLINQMNTVNNASERFSEINIDFSVLSGHCSI